MSMPRPDPITAPPRAGGLPLVGVSPAHGAPRSTVSLPLPRGSVVQLGPGTYLAADPDIIRHILVANHQNYQRPGIFRRLESLIGNGLFLSTGQSWLR